MENDDHRGNEMHDAASVAARHLADAEERPESGEGGHENERGAEQPPRAPVEEHGLVLPAQEPEREKHHGGRRHERCHHHHECLPPRRRALTARASGRRI
jgi:hypothetical protein